MTIAVTGASGQLGRLAIEQLKTLTEAENIVALARSPEKVADLGVEARAFDYSKPDALVGSLAGVEVLALISSSDFNDRPGQHLNVIKAAKDAGVKRIVYTSILRADTSPMLIALDHKVTEENLAASGLVTTVLRNGWYTENWADALPGSIQAGAFVGAAGEGRVSPASRKDYADALAAVLVGEGHEGKTYELAGAPFTLAEFVAIASDIIGKDLPFNNLPEEAYAGVLTQIGLPEAFATVLADADARAGEGWLLDESGTLEKLIGRAPTPVKDVVAAVLAS